jgi:hypothetical protein
MSTFAGIENVAPVSKMSDDPEEHALLVDCLNEARDYLESFEWCKRISEAYFGMGVGGIFAIFLFRIDADEGVDEWLWVVAGDLPSAYLVCDNALRPEDALREYCRLMQDWVDAVHGQRALADVFPVEAEPTEQNAELLERRIDFLRTEVLGSQ